MSKKKRVTELAIGGFRDYYPDLYRKIAIVLSAFREIPKLYGYVEYECPTVEPLRLYELKSGTALIEETFRVTDRKKRRLVLRPETTPSLARMLAAQQQYYPRPIRWFSISRVFRDETSQRGRVKEFWQLNVDILGIEDVAADAEVIDVLASIILSLGFTPADFVIRINDRRLVQRFIESLELTNYLEIIRILDRRDKLLQGALEQRLKKLGYPTKKAKEIALILRRIAAGKQEARKELPRRKQVEEMSKRLPAIAENAIFNALKKSGVPKEAATKLIEFASIQKPPMEFLQAMDEINLDKPTQQALDPLRQLATHLNDIGIAECCEFDAGIARGLDYYTGIVFEAWDRGAGLTRAIAGGGRYDDLVGIFEGQRLPGSGFGFGETVILELAEEQGLIPPPQPPTMLYLAPVSTTQLPICQQIASKLRRAGISIIFNGYVWSLTKHLDDARKRQIPLVAIVGPRELANNAVNMRDMQTGKEQRVKIDEIPQFIQTFQKSS